MKFFTLTEDISVRQAIPEDLKIISHIWKDGVNDGYNGKFLFDFDDIDIENQLLKLINQQDENFKFWVCETLEKKVIGWSTVQPFHSSPDKKVRNGMGFILTYILKGDRAKGLGLEFLQFVIDYCRNHTDIRYILGTQVRENIPSVKISDKVGFINLGKLPVQEGFPEYSIIVCETK